MINHAEHQYINILKDILDNGIGKNDRTGTGTISLFGQSIKHDMSLGFPLLTSKKIHIPSVLHELLFFLKGTDDAQYLIDNKITIWDEWMKDGLAYYLFDKRIYPKEVDWDITDHKWEKLMVHRTKLLPHNYGVKWRNFDGVDQIQNALNLLEENPTSRRIIVSAWDPRHINDAALPWCHDSFQLVVEGNTLDLWWRQRSADFFLGAPFNLASYAFLLEMFCHLTGYKPGILWGTFGDTHLYKDHILPARQQIKNFEEKRYDLPTLQIKRSVYSINDFKFDDFEIKNYESWPRIKAKVSV